MGKSFEKWLEYSTGIYSVDSISLRNDTWREQKFYGYDVVLHVAGIAHVSSDPKMEDLYYKVNRDLTIEAAEKAKAEGVKQFVFLSSIIVYGESSSDKRVIDNYTIPTPSNFYGNSKLQAEEGIKPLESNEFKVVIIRPPMIYGKDSRGNYQKLAKAARKLPIFPDVDNQRSMLHIDNLCEFIRLIIENEESGLFFPQNDEYVKTSEMVKLIAEVHGKNIRLTKLINPILGMLGLKYNLINKVFGNLVYEQNISDYKHNYKIRGLQESIMLTEKVKTRVDKSGIDILIMCDNGLETVGGEQESTKIIIRGIKEHFSVGVIQPGNTEKLNFNAKFYYLTPKTRIKHLIKNPLSFLRYIFNVRKIICSENPRVIHTQAQVSFFIVALLSKFRLIPKSINIIHTERGLYTKYNNIFKQIFHYFIKELDVLVTTTEFNMKYWKCAIEKRREKAPKYIVIENTAGELFESYDRELENPDTDKLTIGFAGRYCDWKNWPLAVEVCKKLNSLLDEKLYVKMAVGCLDEKAEIDTQNMFNELEGLLGTRFHGEVNISIEAMDKFYYELDVFVLTSNYNTESFGRTLVEAMSRNTVVLTTNAGGSVEVVGNNNNVCKISDEFVSRINEFYTNNSMMIREKESNLTRVKNVYSLKNNIDKHIKLYSFFENSKGDNSW